MKDLIDAPSVEVLSDADSVKDLSGAQSVKDLIEQDVEEFAAQAEAEHEEPSEDELGPGTDHDELEEPFAECCKAHAGGRCLGRGPGC